MHICFIIPFMGGGGAERVIANLSKEMVRRSHKVSIMMTAGDEVAYSLPKDAEIIHLGDKTGGNPFKRFGRIIKIRRYFRYNRETSYIGMETSTNIFALIASIGLGINLIVSERVDPSMYETRWLRDIAYSLFAKKIVLQTNDAQMYFSHKVQKKSFVIPNPVNSSLPPVYEGVRRKVILSVGRLEEQKDYPILLKAFAKYIEKNSDKEYQLCIYGKGSKEEELDALAKKLDISDRISFMGFCSNVWEREKDASLYVLSSYFEGMPNSLIEAMAMGLPVISTDCPSGPRDLISNGENGILIPVKDVTSLVDAMEEVLKDRELADRIGYKARDIRHELSLDKICDAWLSVIESSIRYKNY